MAEGLTFTLAGNGVLGDVEPGWSEQEFATPANPNERAGGTGAVSFAAKDVSNGVLAVNQAVTCSYDPLGVVSGVVRTASKTGQRIAINHDTKLARYNATHYIPPMIAANPSGVMSLAGQVLGQSAGFNGTTGTYWSLAGHAAGFDPDGNLAVQGQNNVVYEVFSIAAGSIFVPFETTTYQNFVNPSGFAVLSDTIYATGLDGSSFVLSEPPGTYTTSMATNTKFRLMGKTRLNGQDMVFSMEGKPVGGSVDDRLVTMTCTVDYSAQTITVDVLRRSGGLPGNVTSTVSFASLNRDQELAFRIYFSRRPAASVPSGFDLSLGICNTSDYSTVVETSVNFQPDLDPAWYDPWQISGNVRGVWERTDQGGTASLVSWPVGERQDWETPSAFDFAVSGTPFVGEPAIGYVGSVWDWLQDFCTAYHWEIGLDSDTPTIRPIGTRTLDVDNYAPSPTLVPTTTRTGRSVDVVWNNGTPVNGGLVYDAREDDNRIITVGAAQTTVTKVKANAYLTSVLNPIRVTTFIPGAGTYYVIDSTGLPIVADQWEDYGGRLDVAIDNAEAGVLAITLIGPSEEIPSTTAPYSLAVSDGQNQYAALSILGTGIVADPQTLNLLTGADPSITPQDVAFTVNNAFINSEEQAYDAGIWASVDASGPRVEYSLSLPTVALTGFGDTAGSLISAESSTYRVLDATVGRTATSVRAVRHVTVGDFDGRWAGRTVANHDAFWSAYSGEDQRVLPYLGS